MTKVYVVTTGSYSDFEIESVWSTKEKAQAYLDRVSPFNYDFNDDIDEYELDSIAVDQIVTLTEVNVTRDLQVSKDAYGKTEINQFTVVPPFDPESDEHPGFVRFDKFWIGTDFSDDPNKAILVWNVETDDKEKAVKVALEKAAEILTAGLWGTALYDLGTYSPGISFVGLECVHPVLRRQEDMSYACDACKKNLGHLFLSGSLTFAQTVR